MSHQRGFTVMEVIISMSIVSILLGASLTGGMAHQQTIASSFDHLQASLAASSHLETLDPAHLPTPGTRGILLDVPNVEATETTTRIAEGLVEIRVVVRTSDGVLLSDLTTRIAREVP